MQPKPELMFYAGSTLLEGPCWDAENQCVYGVSIQQCLIYRIQVESGEVQSYPTKGPVGCVVLEKDGSLLSAEKAGLYRIDPSTGKREFLIQLEPDPAMRYNDGKLDPRGRFLVGTKGDAEECPGRGKLFSYSPTSTRVLVEGTTISNGIGFSRAGDFLYFIDTPTQKVGRYHYDVETGAATFDRYVVELEGERWPDGMCVDVDDKLWVAEWGGGCVRKWDPTSGKSVDTIELPCRHVTSCCLGGDNLNWLFITTAREPGDFEPHAGGLFRIKIR